MSARTQGKTGPGALKASSEARKRMAIILETLTGVRTTQEAADGLGVALARYYQLETYALEGFLEALEPRQRGRRVTAEQECEKLRAEIVRLEREVKRQQALYRTTQRMLGVPKAPKPTNSTSAKAKGGTSAKAKKGATRKRRTKSRGDRILEELAAQDVADRAPQTDFAPPAGCAPNATAPVHIGGEA